MIRWMRAFAMALGLYTALPGFARWDDEGQPLLAAMLPFVGLVIGLAWWGVSLAAAYLPRLLGAALVALAPSLLTGFLHLDGFMDVSDAILSARPMEEKRRILKDPHAGAFAVIMLVLLLLLMLGAAEGVLSGEKDVRALWLLPVISRALAGFSVMRFAPLPESAYGRMNYEAGTPGRRAVCAVSALLAVGAGWWLGWRAGVACVAAAAGFCIACQVGRRALGGMNGDISGWSICWAEACGMIALSCI